VEIRKGERVVMMTPGANLDPKVFPDPLRIDLDRANKTHVTFNSGPHRCAGSHLARLELRVFYEEWFKRMPAVRHDPDEPIVLHMTLTMGLERLPIVWSR
jgi:cytochrome P450